MPRLTEQRRSCCSSSRAPSAAAQTTTSTIEGTVTDGSGAVVPGADVKVSGTTLASERTATTGANGLYRVTALPAGNYTVAISAKGFATRTAALELTLNRVAIFDVMLQIQGVETVVDVSSPMVDVTTSATGGTITPRQISELPVNGRNYLDLLQLVPGVAINRQVDPDSDRANPVLGERSGNNNFLIDGIPNKDTVNGGPAQQFTQESIAEFQVLTNGYKAEFGQASGAVVNVITKSGSNAYHGVGSLFCPGRCAGFVEFAGRDENRCRCRSAATPTARRAAVRLSGTRSFSSAQRGTRPRTVNWISSIRIPAARWSTSCSAIRKRRSMSRRGPPRRERSSSSISRSASIN